MRLVVTLKKAEVVKGLGRGKRLGIPTINLSPKLTSKLPEGIYVCRVTSPFKYWGVLHFGPRPTFDETNPSLEISLLDFGKNIEIPKKLDLEIYSQIRKVKKFKTPDIMVKQINQDILTVKKWIRDFSRKSVSRRED